MPNTHMSFEGILAEYPKVLAGRESKRTAGWIQECLYEKFMGCLEELLDKKYGPWLKTMGLVADWLFEPECFEDYTLKAYGASFSLILEAEFLDGFTEYDPLVEFVFDLDEDRYNEAYVRELFERMDAKLSELLRTTYGNWMIAMCKYHWELFNHFGEQIEVDNPIMDPERYFLTHEIVVLD